MTRAWLIALLCATMLHAVPAAAKPACEQVKGSATARAAAAKLRCLARLVRLGSADHASCLGVLDGSLASAFARAEARGSCTSTGNAETVRDYLTSAGAQLASRLQPVAQANRCAAAKLRAARARLAATLRCAGIPACLARAGLRFERAFLRAERRTCLTVGDADAVAAAIEGIAFDLRAVIETGALPPARAPSGLQAVVGTAEIALTWTNPDPASSHTEVKLVRRLNAPPTGADDPGATLVYSGSAPATTEPTAALLPDVPGTDDRTYYYAVFGCPPAGACETTGSRDTLTLTLTQALGGGGYVLYFRHATAAVCTDHTELGTAATTASPDWWKSCEADCGVATARQLTLPTGPDEAAAIRSFFDAHAIPFDRVLSSEFCRCFTTAQLMDLGPTVETTPQLTFFVYDDVQDRCTTSRALAAIPPAPGTNTALVTHVGFVCELLDSLASGEAVVLKPDGSGDFLPVARVTWDRWAALP
jgi:hypothetical protein